MGTKVAKKHNQSLNNISGEIKEEELASLVKFFSYAGMKAAFLDAHRDESDNEKPKYTLRQLNYTLGEGTCKMGMLKDLRLFVDENKEVVEEYFRSQETNIHEQ